MSRKRIDTPVVTEICDWCDEPMDKYDEHDGYSHEPKKAHIVSGYISHPTNDPAVNKFRFLWSRREEQKPPVEYDFHTRCFDDMVKIALATKEKL